MSVTPYGRLPSAIAASSIPLLIMLLLLLPAPDRLMLTTILATTAAATVCEFPSVYGERVINQCQLGPSGQWWCPRDDIYDYGNRRAVCPNTTLTYAGNDPGRFCRFPFRYRGRLHRACIRAIDDVNRLNYWWCATTADYEADGRRWTRCVEQSSQLPCWFPNVSDPSARGISAECRLFNDKWVCNTERREIRECPRTETTYAGNSPGDECHFPFLFGRSEYRSCISALRTGSSSQYGGDGDAFESYRWCATTANYDIDRLWTRCVEPAGGLPWTDHRVFVPVIAVVGVLLVVLGLAAALYLFCDTGSSTGTGRQRKGVPWSAQPYDISYWKPSADAEQCPITLSSAPPSYLEAVMSPQHSLTT